MSNSLRQVHPYQQQHDLSRQGDPEIRSDMLDASLVIGCPSISFEAVSPSTLDMRSIAEDRARETISHSARSSSPSLSSASVSLSTSQQSSSEKIQPSVRSLTHPSSQLSSSPDMASPTVVEAEAEVDPAAPQSHFALSSEVQSLPMSASPPLFVVPLVKTRSFKEV